MTLGKGAIGKVVQI